MERNETPKSETPPNAPDTPKAPAYAWVCAGRDGAGRRAYPSPRAARAAGMRHAAKCRYVFTVEGTNPDGTRFWLRSDDDMWAVVPRSVGDGRTPGWSLIPKQLREVAVRLRNERSKASTFFPHAGNDGEPTPEVGARFNLTGDVSNPSLADLVEYLADMLEE